MKKKIVIFCSVAAVAAAAVILASEPGHTALSPSDLKWGDAPPGLPAGGKMAVLNGDPTKPGPFTVRLQAPVGYKIGPSTHPRAERLTVISGTFLVGMGDKFDESAMQEMSPGSYLVLPTGMSHFVKITG